MKENLLDGAKREREERGREAALRWAAGAGLEYRHFLIAEFFSTISLFNPNSVVEIEVHTQHRRPASAWAGRRGAGARVSVTRSGSGPCMYVYSGYSLQYTLLCAAYFVLVYTTKSSAFTAKIILGTDFEVQQIWDDCPNFLYSRSVLKALYVA